MADSWHTGGSSYARVHTGIAGRSLHVLPWSCFSSQHSAVLPSQGAGPKDSTAGPALNKVTTAMLMGVKSAALLLSQKSCGAISPPRAVTAAERRGVHMATQPSTKASPRVASQRQGLAQPHLSAKFQSSQEGGPDWGGQLSLATVPRATGGSLLALAAALVVPDTKCEELLELLAQDRRPVS